MMVVACLTVGAGLVEGIFIYALLYYYYVIIIKYIWLDMVIGSVRVVAEDGGVWEV